MEMLNNPQILVCYQYAFRLHRPLYRLLIRTTTSLQRQFIKRKPAKSWSYHEATMERIRTASIVRERVPNKFILRGIPLFLLGIGILWLMFNFGPPSSKLNLRRVVANDLADVFTSDEAKALPAKGRLFCFVVTTPKNHKAKVPAVADTWLPRCTHGEFFTHSRMDLPVPYSTVFYDLPDVYLRLMEKTVASLVFAYTKYPDFDWYYKGDDDTFVIMENLMELLDQYDPNDVRYIGYRMRPYLKHGYNAGGAGYVLSRAALKLFVETLAGNKTLCPDNDYEDVGVGRCFANVGVYPEDTRNEKGEQRFNTYRADDIFHKKIGQEWIFDQQQQGYDAMGFNLISLHHLSPDEIRTYYQLLYKVGPHLHRKGS